MKKNVFLSLLVLASLCHANESLLIGQWQCHFTSEIMDADEVLTINADKSYQLEVSIYGSELVDIGAWQLHGDKLRVHRKTHIARGEKKASDHVFTYSIKQLDKGHLIFQKGKGVSTCTK